MAENLSLEHMVWVLDDDLDPMGVVTSVTDYGAEPDSWRVRIRPDGASGERYWEYADLGRCRTKQAAIELVRAHCLQLSDGSYERGRG